MMLRLVHLIVAGSMIASFLPLTVAAPTRNPTQGGLRPTARPTKAPRRRPTAKPQSNPTTPSTAKPQNNPTTPSTAKPQSNPTTPSTAKPTVNTNTDASAGQALTQARAAIIQLIQGDNTLVPQFLRMGFHDCVGGCDGCIDLTNPDNNGLANAIKVLVPVVQQFATSSAGVSRADLWALATVVAVDVGNHVQVTTPVSFTMPWYGRKNCEDANSVCLNASGQPVPCTATQGPHRNLPSVNLNTAGIFSFFANEFGFSERETVAIMGAHNVGKAVRTNSGIDGPGGWVPNNNAFVNQYYGALLGPNVPPGATDQQLVAVSPPWRTFFLDNTGIIENNTGTPLQVPSRNYWTLQVPVTNKQIIMLNADVSLVRDLDDSNLDSTTGHVSCAFKGGLGATSSVCPVASTINFAVDFLDSNVWLSEFKIVLDTMTTNGYVRPASSCASTACHLTPK